MKDITFYLSQVLNKLIPSFRKIEDILSDKSTSSESKISAIKWVILETDAELGDFGKSYIEEFVRNSAMSGHDEGRVAEEHFFKGHDFNATIFLN